VNNHCSKKSWSGRTAHSIIGLGLTAAVALVGSGIAYAQDTAQDQEADLTFNWYRTQPLLPPLRHQRGTLNSWRATLWVRKVMFACPPAQAFPGPSTVLDSRNSAMLDCRRAADLGRTR
jgi:hypothetical protein